MAWVGDKTHSAAATAITVTEICPRFGRPVQSSDLVINITDLVVFGGGSTGAAYHGIIINE
ncbi:MAG: hypothetical protein U5S82_22625 [Gammaproteobacteria bacterium]|nr:hypothetical protein [Gammaproteobacteria bacterium]